MVIHGRCLLNVAQTVAVTEAEGPGQRFALWFQGCPLRCPGCCNPQMLPFHGGRLTALEEILEEIADATKDAIEGITLLGGEPTAHAASAAALARQVQARNLSVMVFTGFTLEELRQQADPAVHELLLGSYRYPGGRSHQSGNGFAAREGADPAGGINAVTRDDFMQDILARNPVRSTSCQAPKNLSFFPIILCHELRPGRFDRSSHLD
jgi:organic radical activating enzyme